MSRVTPRYPAMSSTESQRSSMSGIFFGESVSIRMRLGGANLTELNPVEQGWTHLIALEAWLEQAGRC